MAYKQTPGRGNGMKTGSGLSSALLQTKKRESGVTPERIEAAQKAVKSYKSNRGLSERDLQIEGGAAMDSIIARRDAGDTYSKRELAKIGNKAANRTRKESGATTTVKKTQVEGKKGFEDKYTRTPAKQMSKLKSGKSPAKQMSKMPPISTSPRVKREKAAETMERTKDMPKAGKKAPMKMKKC
jgi:hypothetical protein